MHTIYIYIYQYTYIHIYIYIQKKKHRNIAINALQEVVAFLLEFADLFSIPTQVWFNLVEEFGQISFEE